LFGRIDLILVEFPFQGVELVGVCFFAEKGCSVIVGKRLFDDFGVVLEIENEDVVFFRVCPVQAGERLHGFNAGEHLVHIHGVQQGFVIAGLKLVGTDEETIRVFLNPVGDVIARESVEFRLADFLPVVFRLAREGDDGLKRAFNFREVVPEGKKILDCPLNAAGYDHGPRLTADLVLADHLFEEVVHHDFSLITDGLAMALHIAP
jgi:hypothetical protein